MNTHKTTKDMAEELERQSDEDVDLWTQEPTSIVARPTRTSVLSLRLPTREFHALLQAARAAGESVSQYVRTAIALRQQSDGKAAVNVSYTYPGMPTKVEQQQWDTWNAGQSETELTVVRS